MVKKNRVELTKLHPKGSAAMTHCTEYYTRKPVKVNPGEAFLPTPGNFFDFFSLFLYFYLKTHLTIQDNLLK